MYWIVYVWLNAICHDSIERNAPVASCCFCGLGLFDRVTSADTDFHRVLLKQTHLLRQDTRWGKTHGGHVMFPGSINRTQWTAMGLCLVCIASFAMLFISTSLREASQELLVSVVVLFSPADSCQFSWGLAASVTLCHHCWFDFCYPDSSWLDGWCIGEVLVSGSGWHWWILWTELLISW